MTTGSSPEVTAGVSADQTASTADQVAVTPNTDVAATPADAAPADANPATSSGAEVQGAKKEPESLLDAVKRVVKKPADGSSPDPSKQEGKTDATTTDANADKTAEAKDAEQDVPKEFHKHPAWQRIISERDTLRTQVKEAEGWKTDSQDYRQITGFMESHRLSTNEVTEGFVIMAKLKNDPAAALQALGPIVDSLRETLGETLPKDLQERVDQGLMDEGSAKELARTRGQNAVTQRRVAEDADARQRTETAKAATDLANRQANAVRTWETSVKSGDADYGRKANAIQRYAQAIMAEEGRPTTPEAAVEVVKRAYAAVNADFRAAIPARPAVRPGPSAASSSGPAARPQPTTLLEATRAALAR